MTADTRQDLVDALMVERYTPFRRVETLSLSPADVQAGMARLEAATAEAAPRRVACHGCGELQIVGTTCQPCKTRRDAAIQRMRLHRPDPRRTA